MSETLFFRVRRRADLPVLLVLGGVAALAFSLAMLAQPVADDFNRAIVSRRGWFAYVYRYYYLHWGGRWAGIGLSAFVLPRLDPTRWYAALLAGLNLAWLAALAVFWRLIFGRGMGWRRALAYAVATYALLWALSPAPGETYYWFSGGVEYSLSLSLGVLSLGLLAHGCRRLGEGRPGGWAWVAAAGPAALIIAGMDEVTGCVLGLALLVGWAVAWRRRLDWRPWALALAFAAPGVLVCILAPGNAERGATFKHGHNLAMTFSSVKRQVVSQVLPWALHPALWGATLALWLTPPAGARRQAWLRAPELSARWLLPLATFAATGLWLAVPSWAMGGINGRALDAAQACFVLGWAAGAVAWGVHWGWLRSVRGARRRRLRNVALCVLVAGVLLAGNTRQAAWSLAKEKAQAWSRQMARQREAAARARDAGQLDAVVPRVREPLPPFFFSSGITSDPNDWRNKSFATFYKLKSIRTR